MARPKTAEWVRLLLEGNWQRIPSGGWFPVLRREVHGSVHEVVPTFKHGANDEPYLFRIDGVVLYAGGLTECLEFSEGYNT